MKVFSTAPGRRVTFRVENESNPTQAFKVAVLTTKTNEWDQLNFDFSAVNKAFTYHKIVIIFESGTVGTGGPNFTFLFDDINQSTASIRTTPMNLPVTFDDDGVIYGLRAFEGLVSATIVTDPTEPGSMVGRSVKGPPPGQPWAGATITAPGSPDPGFSSRIPFTDGNAFITMRIWSPDAGIPILLKAEDHTNRDVFVETVSNTTVAGAWENITLNFANQRPTTPAIDYAKNYNKLSIFFNYLNVNATNKTYYFDDIVFGSTTLPIKLLSFTAQKQENTVLLKWSTAFELNNKGVDVERSKDGNTWSVVATVPGTGNHNGLRNYEAKDVLPHAGLNQYRLRQTDFDGKITYSAIKTIDFSGAIISDFKVYPNPATDRLIVYSNAFESSVTYTVLSPQGTVLSSGIIANTGSPSTINVSNLPAGVYYLQLRGDKTSRTTKFAVQ
ncbi:MAG: T9SS C-terminal target domain-containing protein [Bacteroidetes bacterium]|nr:MAG: T9SS C-terminal target domain-containing protein [Bacteroidota bacterium]